MKVRKKISKKAFMKLGLSSGVKELFEETFKGQWPISIQRAVKFAYGTLGDAFMGLEIMRWALTGTPEEVRWQYRNMAIKNKQNNGPCYSRNRDIRRAYKRNDLRFAG
ncbi:hypothetical protein LCGC14_0235260 [marine sediment metagenome]|uniref:Uncharacterized protein n=1 Tax=marine sediment metagenome TaxID=412755 RepID=A0A0F9U8X0_9ZZZZ